MTKKKWKRKSKKWKQKLLNLEIFPYLGFLIICFLGLIIRIKYHGLEKLQILRQKGQSYILAFWHGRLLMIPLVNRGRKTAVLISHHGDGEFISRIIKYFGFFSARGSTTKGGFSALRQLAKEIKNGADTAIAPDGPRGPRQRAQNGAIFLAHLTGCPIVPITFSASQGKFLTTWDKFFIPYPFAKGIFIIDDPIWVDKKESREGLEQKRQQLEERLNEITRQADEYVGKN